MTYMPMYRLSTVRNADNIVVMKAGQIAEQGTHAQLLTQRGIYSSLVRQQSGGAMDVADEDKQLEEVRKPLCLDPKRFHTPHLERKP